MPPYPCFPIATLAGGFYSLGMLTLLNIRNLAIAEDVSVEWGPGLNVITGETGAGKSILAAALGLVLGARADKSMVRSGETRSTVEASFELTDSAAIDQLLDEAGITPCEEGVLMVRRLISTTAAARNLINDCPVTLQILRKLGDLLVDQHGPHDHQSLLVQDNQLAILDSYAHTSSQQASYTQAYQARLKLDQERAELEGDENTNIEAYANPESPEYAAMIESIRQRLHLTSLKFQKLPDLVEAIGLPKERLCTYCWDGCEGCPAK